MIVKYRRLYSTGPYLNEEIGFEISIPDHGDPIAEVQTLKELCDKAHEQLNPGLEDKTDIGVYENHVARTQLPETRIHKESQELRVANMIADIQSCQDLKVLETYKLLVKNNPQLQQVYDETAEKLKNK